MESAGTRTEAERFRGENALARDGEKVGSVDKVLYDKATAKPEWLAVQVGALGVKSRIAPFHGAERREDGVVLPYSAAQIEAAPELESDEISQQLERRLASHYGLQYSESRSPTGLAQGRRSSSGREGSRRSKSTKRSGRRPGSSRGSRRSDGPTREELYQEAKSLRIQGRSKMNKTQLARAVGRGRGQTSSKGRGAKANPFEVEKFLEAVGYPASKRELVREAKEQGAHASVRSTLELLPEQEFDNPAEVSEAIGQLG